MARPQVKVRRSTFVYRFVALTVVAASALVPITAAACTCANRDVSPAERLHSSSAVFAGVVVSRATKATDDWPHTVADIQILKRWKGPLGKRLVVSTPQGSCTSGFELGDRVLVYAGDTPELGLYTSWCHGTKALIGAEDEIKELDAALLMPTSDSSGKAPVQSSPHRLKVSFATLFILMVLLGWALAVRRSRSLRQS